MMVWHPYGKYGSCKTQDTRLIFSRSRVKVFSPMGAQRAHAAKDANTCYLNKVLTYSLNLTIHSV